MIPSFEIHPDIRRAETIPSAWYRSPEAFRHTIEHVFPKSWLCVPRLVRNDTLPHSVRNDNSIIPFQLLEDSLNEPLMLVDGHRVLSNVCTHRGAKLITEPCSPKEIRCPYHGRRYALDGRCIHMPEFKEVENFPGEQDHLNRISQVKLGPLTFVNIVSQAGATRQFDPISERLAFAALENAVHAPEHDVTFEVNAHWALYVENYLEGFHVPFVHQGLNAILDYSQYETHTFDRCVLQIGIAKDNEMHFDLPESHLDFGKKVAAFYYYLFPNTMINVYPWGISLNIVEPINTEQTRIRYEFFITHHSLFGKGAGSNLDTVEHEDDEIVERVQMGIKSKAYSRGRYSPTREQGVHAFHRMLQVSL